MGGPSLFNFTIETRRGRKHKMMHILGIEPGTPGLKQNVLATKPSLLPMLGLYYITKQDF